MYVFEDFQNPRLPEIPDYTVNVLDFGAVADDKTLNTGAFARAIEDCACRGGGQVVVPAGKWLTGAIHMKSNIELHLEEGCCLQFTGEKSAYLPVVYTSFEGIRCYNYSPLIYGYQLHDVAVTGKGVIDGNGAEWWEWKQNDTGVNDIYIACMNDTPVETRVYGEERFGLRPCLLQMAECENVLLEGITLKNSPFWTVHPVWCKDVTIRRLTLDNPFDSPNTDSINVESCDTVLVEECNILGGGDDIYTLKAGRGPDGWAVGKPCQNVLIRNCRASNVRGGGIVIGSEMSGGVKNIFVQDCMFENIMNGIKIKSKKGRGGYVKNIHYQNIKAENVRYGIHFGVRYAWDDQFSGNDLTAMPEIGDIFVTNYYCKKAEHAIVLEGEDGCMLKNIHLNNVTMHDVEEALAAEYVESLSVENICLKKSE